MSIDGVGASQARFGGLHAGQPSGGTDDLKQQIEALMRQIDQLKSQGNGGSEGTMEGLLEQLKKLTQQLEAKDGRGTVGEGQQSGGGGQQITYRAYQ